MTSIPPTGASSRVFTDTTPLRRAVTAFSARGRLPFSTQDSCSTPVFSLEGRIKPSAGLISQRAIDEKQEKLREGRDELCHLKTVLIHLIGEFSQIQRMHKVSSKIFLTSLKGLYSSLKDTQKTIDRILNKTAGKELPLDDIEYTVSGISLALEAFTEYYLGYRYEVGHGDFSYGGYGDKKNHVAKDIRLDFPKQCEIARTTRPIGEEKIAVIGPKMPFYPFFHTILSSYIDPINNIFEDIQKITQDALEVSSRPPDSSLVPLSIKIKAQLSVNIQKITSILEVLDNQIDDFTKQLEIESPDKSLKIKNMREYGKSLIKNFIGSFDRIEWKVAHTLRHIDSVSIELPEATSTAEVDSQIDLYIKAISAIVKNLMREINERYGTYDDVKQLRSQVSKLYTREKEFSSKFADSERISFAHSKRISTVPTAATSADRRLQIAEEEKARNLESKLPSLISQQTALQLEYERTNDRTKELMARHAAAIAKIKEIAARKKTIPGWTKGPYADILNTLGIE